VLQKIVTRRNEQKSKNEVLEISMNVSESEIIMSPDNVTYHRKWAEDWKIPGRYWESQGISVSNQHTSEKSPRYYNIQSALPALRVAQRILRFDSEYQISSISEMYRTNAFRHFLKTVQWKFKTELILKNWNESWIKKTDNRNESMKLFH